MSSNLEFTSINEVTYKLYNWRLGDAEIHYHCSNLMTKHLFKTVEVVPFSKLVPISLQKSFYLLRILLFFQLI